MRPRVWAPAAERVELVTADARHEMSVDDRGWWSVDVELVHGDRYRFSVDGGEPRPDPRSASQPDGVDGASAVVDHSLFDWSDGVWSTPALADAVLYELHIGTFTPGGTFDSAIERLPHLVELGVTAVELMPVNEFSGARGWGYDGVDLFAPHHRYGGPDGLKRLVDACHAHGLSVVMDVVYNHLGPAGNYLREFGPYFTDRYTTPWGDAVNFDGPGSDEVRDFFVDNTLMWLRDYHCDGVRIDAIHAILDSSATHFLEQLRDAVEDLDASRWTIVESDLNDPRYIYEKQRGGYGHNAQWSDDFHHALHTVLTGETSGYYADFGSIEDLATALENAYVYGGRYSKFRGRSHGRLPTDVPAHRFLGYLQNHDQVGNRAVGERSSALMDTELLKVGAALVLLSPFVPMLFQGEEWGASTPFLYFTDHADEALGRAVSQGRKNEFVAFGWDPTSIPDPQDPQTFERSRLRWDEIETSPHRELLEWHRSLIELRRSQPAIGHGELGAVECRFDEGERWLVFRHATITVACNFSKEPRSVPIGTVGEHLLGSADPCPVADDRARLAPGSVSVWQSS